MAMIDNDRCWSQTIPFDDIQINQNGHHHKTVDEIKNNLTLSLAPNKQQQQPHRNGSSSDYIAQFAYGDDQENGQSSTINNSGDHEATGSGSGADVDRTPVNSDKSFNFIDSGTESICGESVADDVDYLNDMATDRILRFFATENSKAKCFQEFSGRIQSAARSASINSTEDGDDDEVVRERRIVMKDNANTANHGHNRQSSTDYDEDCFSSDESTLSESSVLSPDGGMGGELITPESVVAAIDKKIKEHQAKMMANKGSVDSSDEDVLTPTAEEKNNLVEEVEVACSSPQTSPICTIVEEDYDEDKLPLEDEDDVECDASGSDEADDEFQRIPLIRSTSLKTGKTPPGTPGGKKIVRFADAMGLDLETVKHIVDDGPYRPPMAAFKALQLDDEERQWLRETRSVKRAPLKINANRSPPRMVMPTCKPQLRMLFYQPSCEPAHFFDRVRSSKVCLENCMVDGPDGPLDQFRITTLIRVLNIGFEKVVQLRYSTNEWLTFTELPATYVPNSNDGFSDKFTAQFSIAVKAGEDGHQTMMPGQRLVFAIRYLANGNEEYWDNNLGLNYSIIYQRC